MGLRRLLKHRTRKPGSAMAQAPAEPPLGFERLEPRTLLDASGVVSGGILFITGGPDNDPIGLALDAANSQLVLKNAEKEVQRFDSASVNGIQVNPGSGSHDVRIAREVTQPAAIMGGSGKVVIRAGGGPTVLIAGDGNSKLIGGPADNVLVCGPGTNTLVSKSGDDVLVAGTGDNTFFIRGNDTIVGAQPGDQIFGGLPPVPPSPDLSPDPPSVVLTPFEIQTLLCRASVVSPTEDAIIAIVDRGGNILGVRVEAGVDANIQADPELLTFAIDGAVAKARTGAFFGNNQAPLTSRTIQFISQTTMTQREIESNPNIADPNSTVRGPGFVAPIGLGGHFPPNVMFTPQVDLFAIEHTNRDTSNDLIPGFGRFNTNPAFLPNGPEALSPPNSFGFASGIFPQAQPRGIATLPGGVPLYKRNQLNGEFVVVGGIGVFFPGKTGFASEENSALNVNYDPTRPDRSNEAEAIAVVAAGGSQGLSSADRPVGSFDFRFLPLNGCPNLPDIQIFTPQPGRIDLVGITLDIIGPGGREGPDFVLNVAQQFGLGTGTNSGTDLPVNTSGDMYIAGKAVPSGWIVTPHDGATLSAADVERIIVQGIAQAEQTRAAIRLPLDSATRMVFAVADTNGDILGLFRMPDATIFSIDVAVAKARNVAYYANPAELQPQDQLPGVAAGVAFTNRTFRYLALPHFPEGIDDRQPAPFSILNDGGVDPKTGLNVGPPLPASAYQSVQGFDAFNPGTNFRDPFDTQFQNGIVFFPGSAPLYKLQLLGGGFGVSGDGVDQDDVVTFSGAAGFEPILNGFMRSDQVLFAGLRLPYQKFNRSPEIDG